MNIQELSTCFQYRVPVNVVTLNNGYLGMVRQWQELYYGNRESKPISIPCPISSNWLKHTDTLASVWTKNPMLKARFWKQSNKRPFGIYGLLDRQETKRAAHGRQRQRLGRDGSAAAYARNIVSVRRKKCDISYLF